jgi:dTDP-glucose 4,6-dehydratase
MRVLVTGGAGFIGHHLIEHILKNTNWQIVSLDRLDTSGNLNRLASLPIWHAEGTRVKVVFHDLRAPVNQSVASRIGDCEYVFHLAAASHVDRSIENPLEFVENNVVGTCNILEFVRERGCSRFLYFSTDEVFGPAPGGVRYREWDRYNSSNPYAASKAGAEELCLAYENTYKLPILITHTMNVFGERQHPEKFIPSTILKVLNGEQVIIHGSPEGLPGSRFYIHARNVAAAALFVMSNGWPGDKYNIVGEMEVDNLQMAKMIASAVGKDLDYKIVDFHSSRPGHDLRYALDGSRLSDFGFKLPVTFRKSLNKTIKWTLEHKEWLHGASDRLRTEQGTKNVTSGSAGLDKIGDPRRQQRPQAGRFA